MSNINLKRHLAMTHAKLSATLYLHHSFSHFFTKQTISPPTTFPCDLCGRIFGHSDDLNSHIQRRHSHFETQGQAPGYFCKCPDYTDDKVRNKAGLQQAFELLDVILSY